MFRLCVLLSICFLAFSLRFSLSHDANLLSSTELDTIRAAQLQKHNEYRAQHGCSALQLDNTINEVAQKYSQFLATRTTKVPKLVHSGSKIYGENLYWSWGYPTLTYKQGGASDSWYSEQLKYVYGSFPPAPGTGHFTAMIWKAVTTVGFGFYKVIENNGEAIYVVANYSPVPNIMTAQQFADNVPPKQ